MTLSGKILAIVIALMPLCATAGERGKMTCAIDDENATLSLTAGFSHSGEKPLFAVKGVLDVKGAGSQIAKQKQVLKGKYLVQQWFYDQGFNLHFYIPSRDGSFSFAFQTTQNDDGLTYQGIYDFTIAGRDASFEPRGRDGKITCRMD
jgi:hypothetical protein